VLTSGVRPTRLAHNSYSTGEISEGLISLRPPQNTFVYDTGMPMDSRCASMAALCASTASFSVPLEWQIAGAGDRDGDGKADLLWRRPTTGHRAVWFMNGGVMSGASFYDVPASWELVNAGDFDGNGVPDIVWMNNSFRGVTVNYFGGPGGASYIGYNWLIAGEPAGWRAVTVGDFDGNGIPDLVWVNDQQKLITVNYFGGPGGATYLAYGVRK